MFRQPIALYVSALVLGFATATATFAASPSPTENYTAQAVAFITNMSARNFTAAEADFSDQMKQGIPPGKLNLLWDGIVALNGPFEKAGTAHLMHEGHKTVAVVETEFKHRPMKLTVSFDAAGKISGYRLARMS